MNNDKMIERRFLRWHIARQRLAQIRAILSAGHTAYLCTYTLAIKVVPKHLHAIDSMFKATKTGLYMRRGKSWENVDYTATRHD